MLPLYSLVPSVNPVLTACLATVFLVFYALASLQPVSLSVDKRQCFEPCRTKAEVRIPRNVENREVCVLLMIGGMPDPIDRGCWDVSGDSSPVFQRSWANLSAGRYFGQARLSRGRDTYFSNTVELTVIGDE